MDPIDTYTAAMGVCTYAATQLYELGWFWTPTVLVLAVVGSLLAIFYCVFDETRRDRKRKWR